MKNKFKQKTNYRTLSKAVLLVSVSAFFLTSCKSSHSSLAISSPTFSSSSSATSPITKAPSLSPSASSKTPIIPVSTVHASLYENDGQVFGVGMPLILKFSKPVKDASFLEKTIKVTVNDKPADGKWYWFTSKEAHYRLKAFWPAHAKIVLNAPLQNVSAGSNLVYDDNLTLHVSTSAKHVSIIDAKTLRMTVSSDGKLVKVLPVSLGSPTHPTMKGIKIVEEKDRVEHMTGPGYALDVPWSVRITNSGEFLHDAYWNGDIGAASTSHGCTNLTPVDAEWFYNFSNVGDVTSYPNAPGGLMPAWDGFGDWNVSWLQWSKGGAL